VYLTEDILHALALQARGGFRECLKMIELHRQERARGFLNPGIVLTAVATWERFILDLVWASRVQDWTIETDAGWERKLDSVVPWPGSRAERNAYSQATGAHCVDDELINSQVLPAGIRLTDAWVLRVATSWRGADPLGWRLASFGSLPHEDNRDIIVQAMLGARSARDAVAHRLYYKKAREARGHRDKTMSDEDIDQRDWCYVWQSDNTAKSGHSRDDDDEPYPGRPTIQHGYARGVLALFLQLVDITIEVVRSQHGWTAKPSPLPSEWFYQTIRSGPCEDMMLWGGQGLLRDRDSGDGERMSCR